MNIKKLLTKKVGPLPAFAYPLIAVGGYVVYRKVSGGSSSTAATDQTAGTDQLGGGTGGEYYDSAGNLYDANGNLIQAANVPGNNGYPTTPVDTGGGGAGMAPASPTLDSSYLDAVNNAFEMGAQAGQYASGALGGTYLGTAPNEGNASQPVKNDAKPTASPVPPIPIPAPSDVHGNISSVKRLLNGATLTTLAGGRQIEQAPGKTAYVVNKGAGAPARKSYSPPPAAPKPTKEKPKPAPQAAKKKKPVASMH